MAKTEDQIILEKCNSRNAALKLEQSSFITHWEEITRFISPRSARYLRSDRNKGEKVNQNIINETATISSRTLQSGLMAGMSSPARPWFVLSPPDPGMKEFGPVKDWLDTVTRLMRDVFTRSNIYSVLPRAYGPLGDYGTAAFGLLEDEKEVVRGYNFPVGSFKIDCSSRGNVDTLYREYSMTVRQLVETYGLENVSVAVRNLWDRSSYGSWIPVIHAVEPNFARETGKLNSRDKPFISVYYEEGADQGKALRISGFDEFSALAPRWAVNGEDIYGSNCPGMLALGSVKALQLEERRKYQALDKFVNGAVEADAMLRNSGVDLLPGGVTWRANMGNSPHPGVRRIEEINPNIFVVLGEDIKEVENRIRRCYYEDLMLMMAQSDNPQMTAREVEERHQEKLLVLGPMMEQQNDDLFDPLIDRTFNIMLRRGMFPPPPKELQGQRLRVEYTSIMAQAQKLIGVAAVERFVGFVGQVAQYDPTVLDKVDLDQTVDEYGEMTGVSSKIIVPDDVVQSKREQRAKAEQAQQAMAAMPAVAQGANAVKTLGETDTAEVSSLMRLMTGGGA
ncbi:portal protein [Geobacter sp. SVR]|uniref:portal protein n=1 Tax=Geobacter sp. SVR TaxID=2495594 RepID=UPI00143EFF13|nr:portal protein [Geobacter sp. SVR]BCS54772.1 tail protein [Geobacter sp. SVR]GCF86420.1 tail protein [Geobacter sp. SVR]